MSNQARKKRTIYIPCDLEGFVKIGKEIMRRERASEGVVFEKRWMSFFGVRPVVVSDVWEQLEVPVAPEKAEDKDLNGAQPKHLLWALMFMRMYGHEPEMATLAAGKGDAAHEQTFRKWAKIFVYRISHLKDRLIVFENRLKRDVGNDCLMTIDGTDFRIPLQLMCPKAFFSHKFGSSGLRYEVGICIATGDIVWVMGPFPCGDWPDIEIFRYALKQLLGPNERVEADDGYIGEDPAMTKVPASRLHDQSESSLFQRASARLRHETCNRRFKLFKCMHSVFRHDISFHGACLRAVATLTQLEFNHGATLFSVDYNDLVQEMLPAEAR